MTTFLGLDIGTNSVGSAWIDTKKHEITLGVSVFPAGVEEKDNERGTPKNQARRKKRSQRRSIRRRAKRKSRLRETLIEADLLPCDPEELRRIFGPCKNRNEKEEFALDEKWNPWHLRREGLARELSPFEFGRILTHLNQRRGSLGVEFDDDSDEGDAGAVKKAYNNMKSALLNRYLEKADECQELTDDQAFHTWLQEQGITIGRFMADEYDARVADATNSAGLVFQHRSPIRNRRDMLLAQDGRAFHADRSLILDEFQRLWEKQNEFDSPLSSLLTDELRSKLHSVDKDETWRVKGEMFGQRDTYWDAGTLGRCDLEPTDHQCPIGDMYAQEFRVLETVNRIKIEWRGEESRFLNHEERASVINTLSKQKTATYKTIRKALGLHKNNVKEFVSLNIEREERIDLNTNWFEREIVAAFGSDRWKALEEKERDSVNRAFLRVQSAEYLRENAAQWWGLDSKTAELLAEAWKKRPSPSRRLKLSRKAIKNLLPYMRGDQDGHFMGVTEARQAFANDMENEATDLQRDRYSLTGKALTASDRHYLAKHTDSLPPAPTLSNPVVRKAIHEVRRHVNAYLRKFEGPPDRIVVELTRNAKMPAKLRNEQLKANRDREKETKKIIEQYNLGGTSKTQQIRAVQRVKLCIEQREQCAYCNHTITPRMAAVGQTDQGEGIEVDHIIPMSRSQNNGFNNKVLCHARCNRGKGNQTPKEWLSEEAFEKLNQRLRHLSNRKSKKQVDGFVASGNPSKWKNLQRDVDKLNNEEAMDEWRSSQLTDTSYAGREVIAYLRDAIYGGETEGNRHVFASNGKYTAMLRRDWGLVEGKMDRDWHGWDLEDNDAKGAARKKEKDRGDNRHHAIDAVAIALSPNYISKVAYLAAKWEQFKAGMGPEPKSDSQEPPWGVGSGEFRGQVVEALKSLVVSHRPQNRRVVGALHKETSYGKAEEYPGLYTERISIENLKPTHFIEPEPVLRAGIIDRWKIPGRGQGRAIRDPQLRKDLRKCLLELGLDPENFKDSELKKLIDFANAENHKICLPSGVPIFTYTVLLALSDPVCIEGSDGVERFFVGGNNHHMEILEDQKTGAWSSECWDMFTVAQRVRPKKGNPQLPLVIGRQLKRVLAENLLPEKLKAKYTGKEFVMSLAIGETFYLKHKESGEPGYFVVYKLDDKNAFFHAHWDARRASGDDKREEFKLSANQLRDALVVPNKIKIAVDPLGEMRPLLAD